MLATLARIIGAAAIAAAIAHCGHPAAATDIPGAALIEAAAAGDVAMIRQALGAGANVDIRDDQRRTPLLLATGPGHLEAVRVLLEAGADVNAQAANMDTPWMLAGARGHAEILRLMLPKGPSSALHNRFGGNALIPACERAHVEAVKVLLGSRIDVNHVNNLGWTCLLEIVILGDGGPRHVEVTRLVLAAGANPSIADKQGVSPLAHARKRGQTEVAKLIAAAGGR